MSDPVYGAQVTEDPDDLFDIDYSDLLEYLENTVEGENARKEFHGGADAKETSVEDLKKAYDRAMKGI